MDEAALLDGPASIAARGRQLAGKWIRPIVDFALPPRCPGCGAVTADPHLFCVDCWAGLHFLGDPCCDRCGLPFDFAVAGESLCAGCAASPPDFDRARAAIAYGEVARRVALRLKYGGRPSIAETMARMMERHLDAPDALLVPVPLHRWRIWKRGYNQAALIAIGLASRRGGTLALDVVKRTRATPPLRNMNPAERARTVRGAFEVPANRRDAIRGRTIVLVDDIFTTGATAGSCARALRKAGASRIELLCWARVVR